MDLTLSRCSSVEVQSVSERWIEPDCKSQEFRSADLPSSEPITSESDHDDGIQILHTTQVVNFIVAGAGLADVRLQSVAVLVCDGPIRATGRGYPEKALRLLDSRLRGNDGMMDIR